MAYINAEETARIRTRVKEAFPLKEGWKISVRKRDGGLAVVITVLQAPVNLLEEKEGRKYFSVYHHRPEDGGEKYKWFWEQLGQIARSEKWFDKSDAMTDYFHTAYYIDLHCGSWDKPFVFKENSNYTADTEPESWLSEFAAAKIEIIDYSEKAVAVIGETRVIKDELKALGGRFNPRLKCGAGWIFPVTRKEELLKLC